MQVRKACQKMSQTEARRQYLGEKQRTHNERGQKAKEQMKTKITKCKIVTHFCFDA